MSESRKPSHKGPARLVATAFLGTAILAGAGVMASGPAYAACSTVPTCRTGSTVASKFANLSVSLALTTFQQLIEGYLTMISDSLTRKANQGSNNVENYTKTQSALMDRAVAQTTALEIGQVRAMAAIEMVPSRTACRTESNSQRLEDAMFRPANAAVYVATQRAATDYASNAAGGPTERGSLQASQATFTDMMNGFCDPAIMNPPAGVNCTVVNDSTGQPMTFRYTQPYQAVFGVPNGTIPPNPASPENRAARLFVRMATEPVPTDPIRGPALLRNEGQGLFTRRQSDIATINLARGALDRMVDDRLGTTAPGGESVEYLRQRTWADASGMAKDSIDRAGQPLSANADDLGPMIADINKIYLQIYNNLERLASIKATHLARVISEGSPGTASIATRSIGN